MSDTELVKLLNPFISDLKNSGLSNLSCMKRHIALLLSLRNSGYKVQQIVDASEISYSKAVFCTKLSQCKKAYISKLESETIAVKEPLLKSPTPVSSCKPSQTVNKTVSDNNTSPELIYSLDEWTTATKFGDKGVKTYKKAEAVGLCPSDFHGLNSYDSINIIQIISSWTKTVNNALIDDDQKPTKEQFLSKYK